jgi:hypothetical protein
MTRRAVNASFNLLAWPNELTDPTDFDTFATHQRTHYFADCRQIVANGCHAVRVRQGWLDRQPERQLCWTCVGRLVEAAEHAAALIAERTTYEVTGPPDLMERIRASQAERARPCP